jgi:hypothetical protein
VCERREKKNIKSYLQTAESAEAVVPTPPNTKRGHVTMSDAMQLQHSGSERQATRIKFYFVPHIIRN